jgi:hypothetical protein
MFDATPPLIAALHGMSLSVGVRVEGRRASAFGALGASVGVLVGLRGEVVEANNDWVVGFGAWLASQYEVPTVSRKVGYAFRTPSTKQMDTGGFRLGLVFHTILAQDLRPGGEVPYLSNIL